MLRTCNSKGLEYKVFEAMARLCPAAPSKKFAVGKRKKGLDGTMWECRRTSAGTGQVLFRAQRPPGDQHRGPRTSAMKLRSQSKEALRWLW